LLHNPYYNKPTKPEPDLVAFHRESPNLRSCPIPINPYQHTPRSSLFDMLRPANHAPDKLPSLAGATIIRDPMMPTPAIWPAVVTTAGCCAGPDSCPQSLGGARQAPTVTNAPEAEADQLYLGTAECPATTNRARASKLPAFCLHRREINASVACTSQTDQICK